MNENKNYFAQFDYETEKCFLRVVEGEIVIEPDIKFHSEDKQEVADFCKKWNQNEIEKFYVYDTGNGLGGVAIKRQPECKLIDIFTDENEAEKCLINFLGNSWKAEQFKVAAVDANDNG